MEAHFLNMLKVKGMENGTARVQTQSPPLRLSLIMFRNPAAGALLGVTRVNGQDVRDQNGAFRLHEHVLLWS